MARKIPSTKDADPAIEAKAERTVENVREHYERGCDGLADMKIDSVQNVAWEYGVNINTFRKERRFAELYNKADLKELLALRRPDGLPLNWGHVVRLITLPKKSDRHKFQKRAAQEGWTAEDLRNAIRGYRPPKSVRGGRPIKVPSDAAAARRLLYQETERWVQRFKAITAEYADLFDATGKANGELLQSLDDRLDEMGRLSRRGLKAIRENQRGC